MENFQCSYSDVIPLSELVSHERNRNIHPEEQINRLAQIIEYQGQRHPIIISTLSGCIVAGHGRKMALEKLGWTSAAVCYQDFEDEEQEYLFLQSDNAIASWSELDLAGINADLADIGPFNIDLLGIKDFTVEPLDRLEPQCDEDEVPEVKHTIAKRGDVWLLGNHRLMCGDSTMIDDVEKLMSGDKADMVFTDPPYGYKYESNHQKKHEMLKNDDKILDFLPVSQSAMKANSSIYICTSHQVIDKWKPLVEQNFSYKNLIIWKKNNWSMGDLAGSFAGQHELIIFAHQGKVKLKGKRESDIWEFPRVKPDLHPTMKPVELIEYAIEKVNSGTVLDLFLGSGSTLIACEKTNRKCYGMELDEHYCDVIINRWQNYTSKEATLESTGEKYNELSNQTIKIGKNKSKKMHKRA